METFARKYRPQFINIVIGIISVIITLIVDNLFLNSFLFSFGVVMIFGNIVGIVIVHLYYKHITKEEKEE